VQNEIDSQTKRSCPFDSSQEISPAYFLDIRVIGIDICYCPVREGYPDVIESCIVYILKRLLCDKSSVMVFEFAGSLLTSEMFGQSIFIDNPKRERILREDGRCDIRLAKSDCIG
jgi:hypothetical protein